MVNFLEIGTVWRVYILFIFGHPGSFHIDPDHFTMFHLHLAKSVLPGRASDTPSGRTAAERWGANLQIKVPGFPTPVLGCSSIHR